MKTFMSGLVVGVMAATSASAGGIAVYGQTPKSVGSEPVAAASVKEKYDGRFELYQYPLVDAPVITEFAEPYSGNLKQPGNAGVIVRGTFRSNLVRLVEGFNYGPLIWDKSVENCIWRQVTEYRIEGEDPREIMAYYASTQDFVLNFSHIDSHVEAVYAGPEERLKPCRDGVLADELASTR